MLLQEFTQHPLFHLMIIDIMCVGWQKKSNGIGLIGNDTRTPQSLQQRDTHGEEPPPPAYDAPESLIWMAMMYPACGRVQYLQSEMITLQLDGTYLIVIVA